jgi:hypothetical protein
MNLDAIVRSIDEEIERHQRARSVLTGHTAPLKRGLPAPKQRTMSPEARARIELWTMEQLGNSKRVEVGDSPASTPIHGRLGDPVLGHRFLKMAQYDQP